MNGLIIGVLTLSFAIVAFGHEITAEQRKEKIEMHEKMAEHHKMAADCLKAGKPLDECNNEAMKGCPMMGKDCPFMEKGHMDKEMMREHMKKMKDAKSDVNKE
jgi:hypothetical protein